MMEETRNEQAEITAEENTDAAVKQETAGEPEKPPEKMFTQAEVNRMINERLAREKSKRTATDNAELESLRRELDAFKAQNSCYRRGVRDEFVNDVMTLANASLDDATDFETALDSVIKRYPAFVKAAPITTGQKIESKQEEVSTDTLRKAFGLK